MQRSALRSCRSKSNPKPSTTIKKKKVTFHVPADRLDDDLHRFLDLLSVSNDNFEAARKFREKSVGKLLLQRKLMKETAQKRAEVRKLAYKMPANLLAKVAHHVKDEKDKDVMFCILSERNELDRQNDSPEIEYWDEELGACEVVEIATASVKK